MRTRGGPPALKPCPPITPICTTGRRIPAFLSTKPEGLEKAVRYHDEDLLEELRALGRPQALKYCFSFPPI